MNWPAAEIAILKALWPDRAKSCRTIAAELNATFGNQRTKGSIIGQVHRLKLPHRTRSRRESARMGTDAWHAMHIRGTRPMGGKQSSGLAAGIRHKSRKISTNPKGANMGTGAIPTSRMIALVDMKDNECRWPCGDPQEPTFAFCGLPAIQGKPYCLHHNALAWVPSRDRRAAPHHPLPERSARIGVLA